MSKSTADSRIERERERDPSEARSQPLPAAVAEAAAGVPSHLRGAFERWCGRLFERLSVTEQDGLSPPAMADVARRAFDVLLLRRQGCRIVEVAELAAGAHGRPAVETLIVVAGEDKPFIVSSVAHDVMSSGMKARAVLHPVVVVARNREGQLLDIDHATAGSDDDVSEIDESVVVIVADAATAAARAALAQSLVKVAGDVDAAVGDHAAMLRRLDAAIMALEERASAASMDLIGETVAFCRWLRDGYFVFLGMREYRLDGEPEAGDLAEVDGAGLGILRDSSMQVLRRGRELVALNEEVRRFYLQPVPIIITKSNVISRVHRRAHMDYIGLKLYAADGRLSGELRIVGLFTAGAYTSTPADIPFLRLKADRIFALARIRRNSHDGRVLQQIIDTFPRDELFQIGVRQLASWVPALLQLEFEPRIRVFVRRDRFDRFVSVLVFVPRDRFSTEVRERIGELLADRFAGRVVMFQPCFMPGALVRVHFVVGRYEGATPDVQASLLEAEIGRIASTWDDMLAESLSNRSEQVERWSGAFSPNYRSSFTIARALEDMARIDRLGAGAPVAIDFYRQPDRPAAEVRCAIYRFDEPIALSERVPLLGNMGFSAIDERTYEIAPRFDGQRRKVFLHDMLLASFDRRDIAAASIDAALEECFTAVFDGRAENDGFNRLVLGAGLDWREAALLRAYGAYMRQLALPFSPRYVADTLLMHPERARDAVRVFKLRLDPAFPAGLAERADREVRLRADFEAALASVKSLDDDRILRSLMALVSATERTNFFACDEHGRMPRAIALKLAPRELPDAPEPKPFREIFVSSPDVDGVHLRFAPVSRGGIRWSDRAADFRTEVLSLAKAQQVKNAVIVPQGAKGGFVPKRMPASGDRDDIMKAGIDAYRTFVGALLDITDNMQAGEVSPPAGVVRRDGDDPYLVVAADKGTASFSDIANAIAAERGFWLDDAFASGGSAGYDHKKMGITARGAWECVKRHFREMDHDIQTQAFTVAGIGDMSGDVFGNGMLLSPVICLVAAFDHRDIFLDPDPDAARSFAERSRLFALSRSSWQDYDRAAISKGGGVYSRAAKSVDLSPEARKLLALDVERLPPAQLLRAILQVKVDLLWLGGIGTYVRGDGETDADVGDRANDAIRISASQLGARVVGEGANLGMTQRGRIDAARRGVRLNTDFIDNSAGVNSSDQEVNIKIALAPVLRDGRLDRATRNALLVSMTEDVARACLDNNAAQSLAISLEERLGADGLTGVRQLMRHLERRGMLDRALHALPDDTDMETRNAAHGPALTRPEIAVLLSHAKLALSHDLIASGLADDAAVADRLVAYFPHAMREAYAGDIRAHPLRREIVVTALTNSIVNIAGVDTVVRLAEDFGIGMEQAARSALIAISVFDAEALFDDIAQLGSPVAGTVQLELFGTVRRVVRQHSEWCAANVRSLAALADEIETQRRVITSVRRLDGGVATAGRRQQYDSRRDAWIANGVPLDLATRVASVAALSDVGDLSLIARQDGTATGERIAAIASAYFGVADALALDALKDATLNLAATDRYDLLALDAVFGALSVAHRDLARAALAAGGIEAWRAGKASSIGATATRLADISGAGRFSVARLTVAASVLSELAAEARADLSPA
ncbi:MAG: NAD-glutamate dehydrogenase [Hyphomicrobiaceae bacterium]